MNIKSEIYSKGYNIYQFINSFYKRSRLRDPLPEEVLEKTCRDFFAQAEKGVINTPFVYFLAILKKNSAQYHANQNMSICKNEPLVLGEILRGIQNQNTAKESREPLERMLPA